MSESVMSIDKLGHKIWVNSKGGLHRINGPAVEYKNGDKLWYEDDSLHRINGPACEFTNGDTSWFVNGKFLGLNNEGFFALWSRLTEEQKKDSVLRTYFPGDFSG